MARPHLRLHRAVIFGGIAFAIPLAACKWLSKGDEADAGAEPTATVAPVATAPPSPAAPSVAPLASASAPAGGSRRVVVKLPDGGSATIDAAVGADGGVVLPPGFQWPTFPSFPEFDAAALKFPGFDAASLPPMPSGFPKIPGFGADAGK